MADDVAPHIGDHALTQPGHPAVIMSDGSAGLTFAELDARSHALAGQMAAAGLVAGDHVALLMSNRPEFLIAAWAAHRAGLYYTPVNWHLTADEVAYIVEDCAARVVLSSDVQQDILTGLDAAGSQAQVWLCDRDGPSGFAPAGQAPLELAAYKPLDGSPMVYSSGTSGRPKGIKRALTGAPFGGLGAGDAMLRGLYDWTGETVLLCPAPLYHAGPLNFCMSAHRLGATIVMMRSFDPVEALEAIARHRVTSAWLVPTMMIRMLKLPREQRDAFDVSSMTHAVHSAAPCPMEIKQAMMQWWGPVLYEFYAATEGNGMTAITPQEWLAHPGSVGRSADIRIIGEDGKPLPQGEVGVIYFASSWTTFEYHNDASKTAESRDTHGWTTIGDMGYLDADGYLYLTDRKTHMIISGGVNIYPQEAENVLAVHPAVEDVAVIGVPHSEYGEQVKAVVKLSPGEAAGPEMEQALMAYCHASLARYKCPRSVDFVDELPRLPTGKLLKRELRARYWADTRQLV